MVTSFEITPSMLVDAAYQWLEKYANKSASSQLVLQQIQFELELADVAFEENRWLDILEYMDMRPEGWEDVKAKWRRAKVSGAYLVAPSPDVLISLQDKYH